jgi:hypothetical protein
MPLMPMWFPLVGTFGIVLACVGSILSILAFTGRKRAALAITFLLLAMGEIVSIDKARSDHETELRIQHNDIEDLREQLHESETQRHVEHAILQTKLEDYAGLSQLGPALMKLAQTSAEFQKKQYETKVIGDRDLYELTMKTVKQIRDFSAKYSELELERQQARLSSSSGLPSEMDWQKRFFDDLNQSSRIFRAKSSEFRTWILPDALYARNELLERKLPEPLLEPSEKTNVNIALKGMLVGGTPEMSLATYLEVWARPLARRAKVFESKAM